MSAKVEEGPGTVLMASDAGVDVILVPRVASLSWIDCSSWLPSCVV